MSVLWCGGEDIDFPNGNTPSVILTGSVMRSGFARCSLQMSSSAGAWARSKAFPGGAITSAWLSCRLGVNVSGQTSNMIIGFGLSGTSKGLMIGVDTATFGKVALWKTDGTTPVKLATEAGASMQNAASPQQYVIQVINFGTSATVNIYLGGVLLLTYTGDVTVAGMSNFDCVALGWVSSSYWVSVSEVIVSDEDSRSWVGLVTLAPNANGTTQAWSNPAYTNVNPTTINDANAAYTATPGQDVQWRLNALPAGSGGIRAIKIATRAFMSTGTANLANGFNSGGTVAVSSAQAVTTGPATLENLYPTNPVTGQPWGAEVNTLQIDLRSA